MKNSDSCKKCAQKPNTNEHKKLTGDFINCGIITHQNTILSSKLMGSLADNAMRTQF